MKAFDLSHVKMVEGVEEMCGPFLMDVYNVLFNENKISLEEAMRLVAAGIYSPYVLKIPQTQYEGLFKDREVVLTAPTPYGVGFPREANASHLM